MSRDSTLVRALRDLGLTPTDAEVYLGTLRATTDGPASGYRIARDTGRDPANLGKVMAALVRHGAVRIVQDRPRLYEPVSPAAFTAGIVDRVKTCREEALAALVDLRTPSSALPLLLPAMDAGLEQAARLLETATAKVVLHAHPDVVIRLRHALRTAGDRGCRTRVLCAVPVTGCGGDLTLVPGETAPSAAPWLQLVVDDSAWLVAADAGDGKETCGCWGRQRQVAGSLALTLEALRSASGLRCEMAAAASAGGAIAEAPLKFLVRHDTPRPGTD